MALRFELLFSHLNLCRLTEFAGRARDDDQVSTRIIPFSAGDLPARARGRGRNPCRGRVADVVKWAQIHRRPIAQLGYSE
jgi:hypothetical protein